MCLCIIQQVLWKAAQLPSELDNTGMLHEIFGNRILVKLVISSSVRLYQYMMQIHAEYNCMLILIVGGVPSEIKHSSNQNNLFIIGYIGTTQKHENG